VLARLRPRSSPTAPRPALPPERALLPNTAALVAARYAVAALGWIGTLIIVRSLSVEEFGRFSFVFSLLGLLSVFADLGLGRVAIRGLVGPGSDPARFAGTLLVLRAVLGAVSYGLAVGFVTLAGYPAEVVRATALAGLVVLLATPAHAVEAVFQAHLRLPVVAVGNVLGQLAQLALIAALAVRGGSVVLFTLPAVACEVVILAWRLQRVTRLQHLRLNLDWQRTRALVREAVPLATGQVLGVFAYRVDAVMLSRLDSFDAVAVYSVAYKFADIAHYVPSALMVSLLAVMAAAWPDDPAGVAAAFRRGFVLLAVAGVLLAVQFAVVARPLIALLYGQEYAAGAGAARVVVLAEAVGAFGALAFTTLVAVGRHRWYPLASLLGLAANVGLNLWLIRIASYDGAALATLVTEVLVVGLLAVPVLGLRWLRPLPWRALARAAFAGAASGAVTLAVGQVAPWPVAAGSGTAAYAAALGLGWLRSALGVRLPQPAEGQGRP
jgi:O-antigen/teichoic acid export membrane protein